MSRQILVGLCGPAGCGKDSVAKFMPHFKRYALASPLKRGIEVMFDLPSSIWDDRVAKEQPLDWLGKSPRQLAQTLGTEWGRTHVHKDLWVKLMLRQWDEVRQSSCPLMVVTDVRFDNEAFAIIQAGGTVWRVEREGVTPVASHASEAGVSSGMIEGKVRNEGDLDALRVSVEGWCRFLHRRYAK